MEKNLRHIEGGRARDKEFAEKREQQGRESSWRGSTATGAAVNRARGERTYG